MVDDGYLKIQLSEPPDLAAATAAIELDGVPLSWDLEADGYTLRSANPIASGSQALTISTILEDLAGTPLAEGFAETFTYSPTTSSAGTSSSGALDAASGASTTPSVDLVIFGAPHPNEVPPGALGSLFGYHGRPVDLETGFVYFRNRYYDPEIGRFISADPLGFVDGPSVYAFAGYDPVNFADSLGLERREKEPEGRRARKLQEQYRAAIEYFRSTPEGRAAIEEVEKAKAVLNIAYDPKQSGLKVTNHVFDKEGNLEESTLYVGVAFTTDIPSADERKYPKGITLNERGTKDEKLVYRVGHEEVGHFLSMVKNSTYREARVEGLELERKVKELFRRAEEAFPDDKASALQEFSRLRTENNGPEIDQRVDELDMYLENEADAIGWEFVEALRSAKEKE